MSEEIEFQIAAARARTKVDDDEKALRNAQRIVTIDLVKTWSFAFITTSFLSPMFRPAAQGHGAALVGHVFLM